jgi:hypothetical protein
MAGVWSSAGELHVAMYQLAKQNEDFCNHIFDAPVEKPTTSMSMPQISNSYFLVGEHDGPRAAPLTKKT